jgi:hypothetical protein
MTEALLKFQRRANEPYFITSAGYGRPHGETVSHLPFVYDSMSPSSETCIVSELTAVSRKPSSHSLAFVVADFVKERIQQEIADDHLISSTDDVVYFF